MTIKGILLAGAALCTLGSASAFAASAPHIAVAALHGGAVLKSTMHRPSATNVTYTFSVATSVSTATAYKVKTKLAATYYTFQSNGSICDKPTKEKIKVAKKTMYAKLGTATETYSEGCSSGPTTFYGVTYDLKTKKAVGKTDSFVSTLTADFTNSGAKYHGKLNLDITVTINS